MSLSRIPRPIRWSVAIAAIVALLALMFGVWPFGGNTETAHFESNTTNMHTKPAYLDEERKYFEQQVRGHELAYHCSINDRVFNESKIRSELTLCPAYTASVTFNGDSILTPPSISDAYDIDGNLAIDINVQHFSEFCKQIGKTGCGEGWRVWWVYGNSVFPAGYNQHYNYKVAPYDIEWSGPTQVGDTFDKSTAEWWWTDSANNLAIEVYAGDKRVQGIPLTADRLARVS